MRRSLTVLICLFFGWAAISAQGVGQEQQQVRGARENVLVKAEKPTGVPERYQTGFATITGRDSRILLSYLASDLLEGRETGTRGYRLAADYAASLFAVWRLEPAGDDGGALIWGHNTNSPISPGEHGIIGTRQLPGENGELVLCPRFRGGRGGSP